MKVAKAWGWLRIVITALGTLAPGMLPAAEPPRPNLLVFLADDLGALDLGCTGSTFYRTPAIDGLAADGVQFRRGYAACPVCSPTRAALITGRHPVRVGITNFIPGNRRGKLLPAEYVHALPELEATVPELLQQAGYATGCFGKWHLGPPADVRRHGFDTVGSNATRPGGGPPHDPLHARAIAAQASSFIETRQGRPWFCYVPMHSVHVPLEARPELIAEEQGRAAALPPHDGPREPAAPAHRHGPAPAAGSRLALSTLFEPGWPAERHDLAAERPDRARALRQRLTAWRLEVKAKMPGPDPDAAGTSHTGTP